LYKTLVYFYSPAIEVAELEKIKEMLIIELFNILISGKLAKDLQLLGRFTTLKEELTLAGCVSTPASDSRGALQNRGKTLEQIGVEPQFRLNDHLHGVTGDLSAMHSTPYQGAVRLVNALNGQTSKSPNEKIEII